MPDSFKQFCEGLFSSAAPKSRALDDESIRSLRHMLGKNDTSDPDSSLNDYEYTKYAPKRGTATRYVQQQQGAHGFLGGVGAGIKRKMGEFGSKYGYQPVAGEVEPVMRSYDPKQSIKNYRPGGQIEQGIRADRVKIANEKLQLDKEHSTAVKELNGSRGTMDPAVYSSKMRELVSKRQNAIRTLATRARVERSKLRRGGEIGTYYGYNSDGSVNNDRGHELGFAR